MTATGMTATGAGMDVTGTGMAAIGTGVDARGTGVYATGTGMGATETGVQPEHQAERGWKWGDAAYSQGPLQWHASSNKDDLKRLLK